MTRRVDTPAARGDAEGHDGDHGGAQPAAALPIGTECAANPYYPGFLQERGLRRKSSEEPMVPVFHPRRVKAWPNDGAKQVPYLALSAVLTDIFSSDIHFTQYCCPSHPYRLRHDAHAQLPAPPRMELIAFDVDSQRAHQSASAATDDWFDGERGKLDQLQSHHPEAFVYRTRGGYRIVYRAPQDVLIDSTEAEMAWRLFYVRSATYLAARFAITSDPTCKSWAWCFRVPCATRPGADAPEARATFGDPRQVGRWTYVPR